MYFVSIHQIEPRCTTPVYTAAGSWSELVVRYLVTGAAGFIGSHLCERLISAGHAVIGVDNFSDYYPRWRKEANLTGVAADRRLRLVAADLVEVGLAPLLEGVDGVFHLAGQPGVRQSWGEGFAGYVEGNLRVTQRLLEALRPHPVPVVCASSSSVYGNAGGRRLAEQDPLRPVSPYGLTKLAVEHLARIYREEHQLQVSCLRYFTVFGPRQRPDMAFSRFIDAARDGGPIIVLGSGRQTRDYTFVSDVVEATIRALGASAPVYNVGGGHPASVLDVIGCLERIFGRTLPVVHRDRVPGDVAHTWADIRLARAELGWRPKVGLAEGLEAQVVEAHRVRRRVLAR